MMQQRTCSWCSWNGFRQYPGRASGTAGSTPPSAAIGENGVVLVHPTRRSTKADDIPGVVRYKTYEVLKEETHNDHIQWE